ncbi:WD40-repeat-containing domain protein [Zopfochytrium polystomum]|nr:WD40-repeat-containing domain protein [Zopfochytrium polystomum]
MATGAAAAAAAATSSLHHHRPTPPSTTKSITTSATTTTTTTTQLHEARNVRSLAYALVARFLADQGLHATAEALELEAPHGFLPSSSRSGSGGAPAPMLQLASKPLMAILEEYIADRARAELEAVSISRSDDHILRRRDMPPLDPVVPLKTLDTMHTSNILCIAHAYLPTALFPVLLGSTNAPLIPAIATGAADKTVRIAHARSGKLLANLHVDFSVLSVEFHPAVTAAPIVLVAGMDGSHHLYDLRTGNPFQSWRDHTKYVVRASFSPDGEWFATAGYDKTANIYRLQEPRDSDQQEPLGKEDGHDQGNPPQYEKVQTLYFNGPVECLAFVRTDGASGTLIIGARNDNYLHFVTLPKVGDASTTTTSIRRWNMNSNNDDWVSFTPMDLAVSPSGRFLAVYTDAGSGRIVVYAVPRDLAVVAAAAATAASDWAAGDQPKRDTSTSISFLRPYSRPTAATDGAAATTAKPQPLRIVSDLYGVDADAFSRPRCCWEVVAAAADHDGGGAVDAVDGRLFATSDDGAVVVFNVLPDGSGHPQGHIVASLAGHDKTVRGIVAAKPAPGAAAVASAGDHDDARGDGGGGGVIYSCSYDLTVKAWGPAAAAEAFEGL